jgi:hypothetical protein
MPVSSMAGLESPSGSSDDGGFVQDRQRDSAARQVESPGADGAVSSRGGGLATSTRDRVLLREVNDRIAELAGGWNETGVSLFVCECSGRGCAEALEISAAEYERIRADGSHVVVYPGHEQPESERVVERSGRFVVVASPALDGAQARAGEGRRDG